MTNTYRKTFWSVIAVAVMSGLVNLSAYGAPAVRQEDKQAEKEEHEHINRIKGPKSPCVFVSGKHKRAILGVQLTHLTKELRAHFGAPMDAGVLVAGVTADSPADKAGIRVGDLITAVDGEEVSSPMDLARRIRQKSGGEIAEVEVYRDKSPLTLTATIEEGERSEVDLGHFFVEGCDELQFDFDIDGEAIREAIENATRHFQSPEWRSQWKSMERWRGEELEEKLAELEEKLKEMKEELKELELKKREQFEEF